MAITDKTRRKYINSLYSKEEQKQAKASMARHQANLDELAKMVEKQRHFRNVATQDFLLLDERYRILKKHFNLTDKQENEIIEKYRVPSKSEENLLKLLSRK